MQTVLVTGGAGYVGSHVCLRLAEAGFLPVVYDSLFNGHEEFVQWGPLEIGDIRQTGRLDAVFAKHKPVAVLHFAALIEVGESVRHPGRFYDNNVAGALTLIEAAQRAKVQAFVFSSTCATYGAPRQAAITEDHPQDPLNPYGRSKLMVEQVLRDLDTYNGFRSIALRYFNAAGADPEGRIGERHEPETHAIPLAIRAAMNQGQTFTVFGEDYPTPDGTAVRDYIHVLDLADAHVLALKRLLDGGPTDVFNLGTGTGTSVRELVETIRRATNRPFEVATAGRREGDAAILVADNAKAREVLGWSPKYGFSEIIETAWRWHEAEAVRAAKAAV
jgi:UDP-glucose 4-epimerase